MFVLDSYSYVVIVIGIILTGYCCLPKSDNIIIRVEIPNHDETINSQETRYYCGDGKEYSDSEEDIGD